MATPSRPIRLTDVMILVGTLAVGFGIVHEGERKGKEIGYDGYLLMLPAPEWLFGPSRGGLLSDRRFLWVPLGDWSANDLSSRLFGGWTLLGPCLLMLTFAVLGLGLLPPRMPTGQLARRPGWLGCIVSSSMMALTIAPSAWLAWKTASGVWVLDLFEYAILFGPMLAGVSVAMAWSALFLTRRIRLSADWLEMLGLGCSLGYIAAGAVAGWFFTSHI